MLHGGLPGRIKVAATPPWPHPYRYSGTQPNRHGPCPCAGLAFVAHGAAQDSPSAAPAPNSARDPARGPVWAAVAEARRLVPASRRPSRVHERGRSLAGELIDADLRRASCRRVRAAGREGEADTWSARSELRLQAVRPPAERNPNVRPAVLHRCCTESPSMDGNRRKSAVFRGNDLQRAQKQVAPLSRGQVFDFTQVIVVAGVGFEPTTFRL